MDAPPRTDLVRPPHPDEPIPVPLGERRGLAVPAEELEEHLHRGSVVSPRPLCLGGSDLFTVDVKQRPQGERLGLGWRLAVELRAGEACGELVCLPLRPPPVAVPQRPAQPAAVLAPLDLDPGRSRDRERPGPGSGPIHRRCSSGGFVSCVPSVDSSLDDGLHDLRDGKFAGGGDLRQTGGGGALLSVSERIASSSIPSSCQAG